MERIVDSKQRPHEDSPESCSRRKFIKLITGGVIGSWVLMPVPLNSSARYIVAREESIAG
ncbi:MAG: hypothetical protein V3U68_04965 [Bacteroidota bacterium]